MGYVLVGGLVAICILIALGMLARLSDATELLAKCAREHERREAEQYAYEKSSRVAHQQRDQALVLAQQRLAQAQHDLVQQLQVEAMLAGERVPDDVLLKH